MEMSLHKLLKLGSYAALVVAVGTLFECAAPQRPYQFSTTQMARDPVEALAAALTQASQTPVVVDPQTGQLHTRWQDTGVRNGLIKDREATIVRRYSAKLERGAFGNYVTVAADAQRCVVREFTLTEIDVQGNCVPMERLTPEHQKELLHLGERVQQSMSVP